NPNMVVWKPLMSAVLKTCRPKTANSNACTPTWHWKHCPQGCHCKKTLGPSDRRPLVRMLMDTHDFSERRACRAIGLSRSVVRHQPAPDQDGLVIDVLQRLAERHPDRGFGKLFHLIRRQGHKWNHKRVYRVYCKLGLNLRRRYKKRLPNRYPQPLQAGQTI